MVCMEEKLPSWIAKVFAELRRLVRWLSRCAFCAGAGPLAKRSYGHAARCARTCLVL